MKTLRRSAAAVSLLAGCQSVTPEPTPTPPLRVSSPSPLSPPLAPSPAPAPSGVVQAQATAAQPPSESGTDPTIDLAGALELAGVSNPTVNLAREAAREAEASLLAAEALKLPSLSAGLNFRVHRGNLLPSGGTVLDVDSQSLYFGSGAGAVGTAAVAVPGVSLVYPLADIIAEPRAASARLAGRRADAGAVTNEVLLDVATAYLELVRADAAVAELTRGERDFAEVARLTAAFAQAGQGRAGDANRVAANLELVRGQLANATGERAAASARLAELLGTDPAARLAPPAAPLVPLQLIDASAPTDALVAQAEANRPELVARSARLAEAQVRVRQEETRPLLPTLSAGFSVGGFGGGSDLAGPDFGRFGVRTDFRAAAVWNVRNLGFGNRALVARNRSAVAQASARLVAARDRVREEVAAAQADIIAAAGQIETAKRRLATAEDGFRAETARTKQGEGLPLEALDSTRSLTEARLEVIRAVTAHNVAQFRLLAAVGTSPGIAALPTD